MLKLIHMSGNILMVKSCYYGRCYVKKLIPLCTFLKFHTHLEENLARSLILKCFWQVFKGLKSCIFKKLNFSWKSPYSRVPYHFKEGVIHRGRKPRWITPSEICRILHILRKPNSIIALLFIQNITFFLKEFRHYALCFSAQQIWF